MRVITVTKWGQTRHADAHDMYALLGVTKRALPVEGMPERVIQGVRVYVKPLAAKVGLRRNFQGLRVMAICECGKHLPVGRLHQHKCKCERCGAVKPVGQSCGCFDNGCQ